MGIAPQAAIIARNQRFIAMAPIIVAHNVAVKGKAQSNKARYGE